MLMLRLLEISGFAIVAVGSWYAVTGAAVLGIAVAGIGTVVIAVVYGAVHVCRAVGDASARLSADVEALTKSEGSLERLIPQIDASFTEISKQINEKTKYIVASMLAAAAREHGSSEENLPAPLTNASAPPPYVTARRAYIAAEVLRELLTGRTHAQALEYTADKFQLPETVISEAWNASRIEAYDLVWQEIDRRNWELTDEAWARLRKLYTIRETQAKKQGRLGEVITAIREDFIRGRFQRRVEKGVVLSDERKEAKALLDELRKEFQDIKIEIINLPRIKTIMEVIERPHRKHRLTEYSSNQKQMKNFAMVLKLYRDILQELKLHHDDFFKDHPWS